MKRHTLYLFATLTFLFTSCKKNVTTPINTETKASMKPLSFTASNNTNFGYWLYTPANPTANMPLIVYLHGSGAKGTDLNLLLLSSLPKFIYDSTVKNIPAYVLMPQCPTTPTWEQIATSLIEMIDFVKTTKQINGNKISLTGYSFGGTGTWKIGATYATKFSCIAPVSGFVQTSTASSYKNLPLWAFVGSADVVIDPISSTTIIPTINSLGGNAQIKTYNGAQHFEVPELTYKDAAANLLSWMITHTK